MPSRYRPSGNFSYAFGPGPATPAVKALLIANTVMFVATFIAPELTMRLGLRPADVIGRFAIWQCVTYLFVHGSFFHILFNMLTLWMFGVELERMWGTKYFVRYYFTAGIGAGLTQIILGVLPFAFADQFYYPVTIGASGAVYGLLLAYAMYFPNRPIYMYFVFAVPAKYFVMILGAIALLSATSGGGGVAHTAHLGGLAAGYLYLKSARVHPISELKYRFLKWRINRMRRKFDVYSGGRADDVNRRVH
jgi:membrane associated rhomboid family serine protease